MLPGIQHASTNWNNVWKKSSKHKSSQCTKQLKSETNLDSSITVVNYDDNSKNITEKIHTCQTNKSY